MSGLVGSSREKNCSSVGMDIAGAWTYRDIKKEKRLKVGLSLKDARDAHLFHDTFLRADGEAIVELVLGEVYLWHRLLVLYLVDSFLELTACPAHRQSVVSGGKDMVVVKIVAGGH